MPWTRVVINTRLLYFYQTPSGLAELHRQRYYPQFCGPETKENVTGNIVHPGNAGFAQGGIHMALRLGDFKGTWKVIYSVQ
ncbi:hypothetical protein V8C37DRAFT_393552 [Trichoderma ceciliae]